MFIIMEMRDSNKSANIDRDNSSFNVLSVNEKLPVPKLRYFGKYIIQLDDYFTFVLLVNGRLAQRKKPVPRALELCCK